MNIYLIIIGILIIVLGSMSSACFTNIFKSKFSPIDTVPGILKQAGGIPTAFNVLPPATLEPDTHYFDSRYQYPYNPPVNPIVKNSVIQTKIPASPDLYFTQTYDSINTLIDSPPQGSTNELYYSGGLNQMIQIPLQYNTTDSPEILRSQDILITPYNRIKYSTGPPSNSVF